MPNGFAEDIEKNLTTECPDKSHKIQIYNSNQSDKIKEVDMKTIMDTWSKLDCIITTPTIEAGVSYDCDRFDIIYGVEVDTQGYESVTIEVITGARTDGTVTPLLQESDVSGSYSGSVADEDLIGLEADAALLTAQSRTRFGYIGKKRYVRVSLVSTSVTTGLTAGASVILGHPKTAPVA